MRERKRPGQRLSLSASDWNAAMEAADVLLGGKLNRRDNTLTLPRGNQDVLGKTPLVKHYLPFLLSFKCFSNSHATG